MKRIAIIGGGISGLSSAFTLEQVRRNGAEVEYKIFEASSRLGGVLLTEQVGGCLVEAGPDSFLTEKPWAADLCKQLGIAGQLIGSSDAQRKTYILLKGRLVPLPDGLMFMVPSKIRPTLTSPLFSAGTKLRILREWFQPPRKADADESVASLIERHYGSTLVDRLADPLLSGVYGGEASKLSVRAVLPRFAEMETTHGSLGRGMMAARKNAVKNSQRPLFTSLKNGMQQLADTLAAQLPPSAISLNTAVQLIQPQDSGWIVSAGYKTDQFDAVIVATSAPTAAAIVNLASAPLALELNRICYSSSVTVALGYGKEVRAALPPGFGFLVPYREGRRLLAATFVHNKFPHRAPDDRALIRCFLGGTRDEAIVALPDGEILNITRDALKQILHITADPLFSRVYKWKSAMAQYNVGHLERLEKIENLRPRGIYLAGNGYRGIGVPDCVRSGKLAAEQALSDLT